jgi:hypothetical protein
MLRIVQLQKDRNGIQGSRSLGTIKPRNIHEVKYAQDQDGAWDYRLAFYDATDKYYRLKITNLTW